MKLFEKLKQAKGSVKQDPPEQEETKEAISEKDLHETLKSFLYSDDLVEELKPVFRELYKHEEFKQVVELIQAKEEELNNINASEDHFKQTSETNDEMTSFESEDNDSEENYLMQILNERYGE